MVGVLAFCYTICWTVILMRILLMYVYGWRNYYYDQIVIVLTTFDPLINHCVCLWIMRKYRDGYASSMGSLMSCFKISDDGIWATTITRLSTISRRSTYSRASTRSSSRQSSKPYFYKQVPQNAENPQQEIIPDREELPERIVKNKLEVQEDKISDKRIVSDGKREWSEIIREVNAEKDNPSSFKSSCRSAEDIKVLEGGALNEPHPTKRETVRSQWKTAFEKIKEMKRKPKDLNYDNTGVSQGSTFGPNGSKKILHETLATVHEKREDTSELQSTASEANADLRSQKVRTVEDLKRASSDDIEAKEEWEKIIQKLNDQTEAEPEKKKNLTDSSEASLPQHLRELEVSKGEQKPKLLKDGANIENERAVSLKNLPEIIQDSSKQDDKQALRPSTNLETSSSSHEQDQAEIIDRENLEEEEKIKEKEDGEEEENKD